MTRGRIKSLILAGFIISASMTLLGCNAETEVELDYGYIECERLLQLQLSFRRSASSAEGMNAIIRQIQKVNDTCFAERWDPQVNDDSGKPGNSFGRCFVDESEANGHSAFIGNALVPAGLRANGDIHGKVRETSGRDSLNNIIVYWNPDPEGSMIDPFDTKKRKLPVLRPLLPATLALLVTLATLIACSDPTPTPESLALPTVSAPTEVPAPRETPTETPTAAPTATPASSPALEATATPVTPGLLAPLRLQDSLALRSALSEAELACIGEDPEKLARMLTGQEPTSREERARFIGCLGDETVARTFLAGFVPGPGPLSQETSDCVRAAFEVIDPRAVMTAGIEGDPGRAMSGSMAALSVTMACLNDEEWEATAPQVGMGLDERAGMQCLMAELGGPGPMAGAMIVAGEGDFTDLAKAGADCELDMGPDTRPGPVTPPPTPTATVIPPTSVPTSRPVPTRAAPTTILVITVAPIPANIPEYDRGDWKHWVDEDGDCQDARQEVLVEESLDEVTFETDRQCRVETGRWYGAFTAVYVEDPGDLDIDHMVPLKNAHLSGAWAWNPAMKEEYANYLEEDNHLIAVTAGANRSKGAKGPEEWGPPDLGYWCQYATDWTEVKARWELTMTKVESEIVMDMLGTCENPPDMEVEELDYLGTATGEHKPEPTEELQNSVYGSCEEAESAGEQRVQGSRGGGEGFPKAMVPSARDGDGDGVVCER